ncbi:hypothetical protein IKM56_01270 [Candidatus Saccharibacteria bacterium]|nr:hypothetical protein [Candidatus Saccharibacteria bacterium]
MIKKQSTKESNKFGSVKKKFFALAIMMAVFSSLFVGYTNVYADPAASNTTTTTGGSGSTTSSSTGNCKTGILPQSWCDQGIEQMIKDVASILTALIFVAGTGFIVYAGFIWATAGDNPSRVATAKKRILEIVIGMVFFLLINLLIQFLIGN